MKNSFLKIFFALVFLLLPLWPSVVSAGTAHNISGYAWSSNIGWISFNNCTNPSVPSTCTGTSYGVNKDGSGNLVGYAWSENIGWIQFGNLDTATMPNGSGNTKTNAKVDVSNKLTGWAKALSANGNGWDGWISLSGTSPNYGVTLTNTGSTSYDCLVDCVWGSDVVGWVDWSGVVAAPTTYTVTASVSGSNGTISPPLTKTVNSGSTTTFTITPNSGYTTSIAGTCPSGTLVGNTYTTGSIVTDCTVVASFTIVNTKPTLTNPTATDIKKTGASAVSAKLGATVTSLGSPPNILARGTCWGTSPAPTTNCLAISPALGGTIMGAFSHSRTKMTKNTVIYYRGYAENSYGRGYSSDGVIGIPTVTTNPVTSITQTTATSGGNATSDGGTAVTARGIVWSTSVDPTILSTKTTNGTGTGSWSSNMTGLTANTTYHVRAYATNSVGTAYGADITFMTSASNAIPTVTNPTAINITSTGATLGANVISLGIPASISARGTCWGTAVNPAIGGVGVSCLAEGGVTTGTFTHLRTGMSANTLYHYRGYATNNTGTGYSNDATFTTGVMSGTLTPSSSSCTIPLNASSCNVDLNWSIINPEGIPTSITASGMTNIVVTNTTTTPQSGTVANVTVPYNSRTFYLYNNGKSLVPTSPSGVGITVTSSCVSGTTWDGSVCASTTPSGTDGRCHTPPVHYTCESGNPENPKSNAANWTWNCVGSTSTASCSQPKKPPVIRED